MSIRVTLHHRTSYDCNRPVRLTAQKVRLRRRRYATCPVNAKEAEARRATRFAPMGHTAGALLPAVPPVAPENPLTLDLRRS